ncbi:MAG TPA: hypothetical protein PKC89_11945 [Pyrinomonadaceae bacterium]|nr:hypothetical protein [Pyrinomonadaceae bacterium]
MVLQNHDSLMRIARWILSTLFIFGGLFGVVLSQGTPIPAGKLISEKPSVYLSFDGLSKASILEATESNEGTNDVVWLTLHNNLSSFITVCSHEARFSPAKSEGIDYKVESDWDFSKDVPVPPQILFVFPARDTCGKRKILPGESFRFAIRRDVLVPNSRVVVSFNYAWESSIDVFYRREPEHIVFLDSRTILSRK